MYQRQQRPCSLQRSLFKHFFLFHTKVFLVFFLFCFVFKVAQFSIGAAFRERSINMSFVMDKTTHSHIASQDLQLLPVSTMYFAQHKDVSFSLSVCVGGCLCEGRREGRGEFDRTNSRPRPPPCCLLTRLRCSLSIHFQQAESSPGCRFHAVSFSNTK